ncbi:hypothetical protein [Streptomyces chartreusis]|uniref:hypothetical protein n=1 Tax=Streptomyces chartreusis TaxID=1969 RepID=UPI0036410E71
MSLLPYQSYRVELAELLAARDPDGAGEGVAAAGVRASKCPRAGPRRTAAMEPARSAITAAS